MVKWHNISMIDYISQQECTLGLEEYIQLWQLLCKPRFGIYQYTHYVDYIILR